jgi:DNA-binding HxlR family transcriptional regulator
VRSYHQYCGLARTLDVVGDRWSLLIIRELGIRPCRYRDLRDGLPGIATNLLSERLRQLQSDGVIEREEVPPPVGATVYRLSPHGRRLLPILGDLARWGAGWMERGQGDDVFRGRWLVLAAAAIVGSGWTPGTSRW